MDIYMVSNISNNNPAIRTFHMCVRLAGCILIPVSKLVSCYFKFGLNQFKQTPHHSMNQLGVFSMFLWEDCLEDGL
jgi:hypothetical protein